MFKNQDTEPENAVLMGLLSFGAILFFAIAGILYSCGH